jgi:hypothetical protein
MKTEEEVRAKLAEHVENRAAMRQRFGKLQAQRQRISVELATLQRELVACEGMIAFALDALGEQDPDAEPPPQPQDEGSDAGR